MNKEVIGIVQKLSEEDLENIKAGKTSINLGGDENLRAKITEALLTGLLGTLKQRANEAYVLNWIGTKVPHGTEINGQKIGWTQNGVATDVNGKIIGYYDRLLEWGGEGKNEHCMVIFTDNPALPR